VELLLLALPLIAVCLWLRARQQHARIRLLAGLLGPYSIETHVETLTQGYLRALGEKETQRQEQVWRVLRPNEDALCRQLARLAEDAARAEAASTRVSRFPMWLPVATEAFGSFDLREALGVHARGICRAVELDAGTAARDRAFAISAELFLMQHTCHWFCRSKLVASARMQARHRTRYEQVLASVLRETRSEYLRLVAPGKPG
jgi:hypothetical protein